MSGLNKYQKFLIENSYKSSRNKANMDELLAWYEENDDLKKRVDPASIWIDAEYIPETAPILLNGGEYKITLGNFEIPVLKYYKNILLIKVKNSKNTFKCDLMVDSIESEFGNGYTVTITDSFGDTIPFGMNRWLVDAVAGTVTFLDGIPERYETPYYVTFYKYVGRKGDNIITTDGHTPMMSGYEPSTNLSLATKEYVDRNVTDMNDVIRKLIPNTPETFENKDLEIIGNTRKGQLLTFTDPAINVFYSNDSILRLKVPQFWNKSGLGYFSIYVNSNRIHSESIQNLMNGTYNQNLIQVESIVDSYQNELVADDFYKSINLSISLNYISHISPYIPTLSYPVFQVKVKWSAGLGIPSSEEFSSNPIIIGVDEKATNGFIKNPTIADAHISHKYISGVPAMIAGDTLSLVSEIANLKKFKKDVHGHITINDILEEDILTHDCYPSFSPVMNDPMELVIPENHYSETMTITITSENLDGDKNGELITVWNTRIDSVSDESKRVTSPDASRQNFGRVWDEACQSKSLKESNELQMLNGKYQWPRGNYVLNGVVRGLANIWGIGPDYTDIPEDGVRYVTFKFNVDNINGFYFTFDNAEGLEYNRNDFTLTNIESLWCIVDGKEDWLNMNIPFDGVMSPFDTETKGCLVVNRSNENQRYCTFGTEIISGNVYIVFGIKRNPYIKISGISVFDET